MKQYAKHLSLVALLLGFCLPVSGCLKTKIVTDKPASSQEVELAWAHGFVTGLVPPVNAPLEVGAQCENGVSEVYFRQTFIQGLAEGITQSLYNPQRFTVTCASGGATSSVEHPPAYLPPDRRSAPSTFATEQTSTDE